MNEMQIFEVFAVASQREYIYKESLARVLEEKGLLNL